ncbi:MAG: LysM peptidoglycan-binding domain-containing protein [Acidimicrobiia bacterium]
MDKAKLIRKIPPEIVQFDFNPSEIKFTRTAKVRQRGSSSSSTGSPAGSTGSIFHGSAQSKIMLTNVVLTGGDTKARCDTLLSWMSPGGGLVGQVAGAAMSAATGGAINLASKLPTLTFQWGPPMAAFMYEVVVEGATVVYERFSSDGTPERAKVTLTLVEQPSLLGSIPTNPTSGGLPGRASHTISEGETLPGIATARYGRPGYWRAIASVNGIDDPFRIRPGQVVYLPGPGELADLRGA